MPCSDLQCLNFFCQILYCMFGILDKYLVKLQRHKKIEYDYKKISIFCGLSFVKGHFGSRIRKQGYLDFTTVSSWTLQISDRFLATIPLISSKVRTEVDQRKFKIYLHLTRISLQSLTLYCHGIVGQDCSRGIAISRGGSFILSPLDMNTYRWLSISM